MDRIAHRPLPVDFRNLSRRAGALSQDALPRLRRRLAERYPRWFGAEISPAARRRRLGLALLVLSLGLGAWAYEASTDDALWGWKSRHFPSNDAWSSALGSRGYQSVTQADRLNRVLRTLPSQLDVSGSVWSTTDQNWIAIYPRDAGEGTGAPVLYCYLCEELPLAWNPEGRGWDGFDQTIIKMDRGLPALRGRKPKKSQKREEYHDPRELRY